MQSVSAHWFKAPPARDVAAVFIRVIISPASTVGRFPQVKERPFYVPEIWKWMVTPMQSSQPNADSVSEFESSDQLVMDQSAAGVVHTRTAHISQSAVNTLNAEYVESHQSPIAVADAETLYVQQGAVLAARAEKVWVEQAGAAVLVGGTVEVKQGGAGVIVANTLNAANSRSLVTIAGTINGPVETVLDTRGALLAGLSAGVAIGLIFFLRSLGRRGN